MTLKTQKILTAAFVSIAVVGGFQILILLSRIYQIRYFLFTAIILWLYLWLKVAILYDLHFKIPRAWQRAKEKHAHIADFSTRFARTLLTAIWHRAEHLFRFRTFKHYLNYLLLPGFIFWSTVAIIFVNTTQHYTQQLYAWLSSVALIVAFWYLKEIFTRKNEKVDHDIFVALSVVKIYAVTIAFASGFIMFKRSCVEPWLFVLGVFAVVFLFIYQALFQHNYINKKNLGFSLLLAASMSAIGYLVYVFWGFNYFTAGVFMAGVYNFLWGIFHYRLDNALTKKNFYELLLILLIISYLVFTNTNFKERIIGGC